MKSLLTFLFAFLSIPCIAQTQLINNGTFTNSSSWNVLSGSDWYLTNSFSCFASSSGYAFFGTSSGGYINSGIGSFNQQIVIPSNTTSAILTYKISINTYETTSSSLFDICEAQIRQPGNLALLHTFNQLSNLDGDIAPGCQTYQTYSHSIPSTYWNNNPILINFQGASDNSSPTIFRIDDVSVIILTSSPSINLSGNLNFGSVQVGSSSQLNLTITNTGNAPLNVGNVIYPNGFSGNYSGIISAGNSQVVPVTFAPSASTAYGGTITVNSNAVSGTNTITCSGTGTSVASPSINLSGNLNFGSVQVGSSSQLNLTITNTGNAPLNVGNIIYPNGFSGNYSGIISAGNSQVVPVTFAPSASTAYGGTITVNSNAVSGTNAITCSGTGTSVASPSINLSGNLNFGSVQVGSSSQLNLTITNTGNAPLNVGNIIYPNGFSGNYSGIISAGNSQVVPVTFAPSASTAYGGTITVNSNAVSGTNAITCSGTGTSVASPSINLSGNLNFGSVQVGSSSQLNLTITNTGNAPLNVGNVIYPNGFSGNYSGIISAGNSQVIPVFFSPSSATSYGGTITVLSNASGGNDSIACSGTGILPTLVLLNPNGGEMLVANSTYQINATFSGINMIGYSLEYSMDGGGNWAFIHGTNSTNPSISYQWVVPNYVDNDIKIRAFVSYNAGFSQTVIDESDANFSIIQAPNGFGFSLNPIVSHLHWPFSNSTWNSRNGWKGATGGIARPNDGYGPANAHGEGGHRWSDFFADDWNNTTLGGNNDCHEVFYAPISGTVVYSNQNCMGECSLNCFLIGAGACCGNGFGNQIVIQSNIDPSYAFRVGHLFSAYVANGSTVTVGQAIGEIGMTGKGDGAHAHCALYKNINQNTTIDITSTALNRLSQGLSANGLTCYTNSCIDNNFACDFLFDAIVGGAGGGTQTYDVLVGGSTLICPGDSVQLTMPFSSVYYWSTGATTQSIFVSQSGNYSGNFLDSIGNSFTITPVEIVVNQSVAISLSEFPMEQHCIGDTVILSILDSNLIGFNQSEFSKSLLWSNGDTTTSIKVTTSGIYSVSVNDVCNNVLLDSISLVFNSSPQAPIIQSMGNLLACNTANNVSYQWLLNGNAIAGATGQFFQTDSSGPGFYAVQITDLFTGCSSISAPLFVVGINDLQELEPMEIYPNPARDEVVLTINFKLAHDEINITLFNMHGQRVLSQTTHEVFPGKRDFKIFLSSLDKGIYFIEASSRNSVINRKKLVVL